jgi:hypothetical protein
MKKEEYTPLASHLQTKLSVGAAGDIYEPEADRVAEPVMGMAQPRKNRKVSHHEFHPTLATAQSIARSIPVLQRQGTGGTTSPLTGLQNLLHLRFSLGTFNFNLDLPSQVTVSLPITLRNRQILEFRLIGETAGNFSFSATYDGIPQVRISLRAGITGVAGSSPQASAGLTIQTTRTTCHAPSPEATRASLQSAGERVKRAIEAVQNAPTEQEGETVIDVASRYAELAAAIANLHSAVERAQSLCTQVPVVTFDFGARTPLTPMQPGETNSNRAPYIGGGVIFHF